MKARTKGSILVASAIVALIGSGAAVSGGGGDVQWRKALEARSEALNERYGLGAYALVAGGSVATSAPSWMRALRLRSEALNRHYGLGVWEFKRAQRRSGTSRPGSAHCAFGARRSTSSTSSASTSRGRKPSLRRAMGPPVEGGPARCWTRLTGERRSVES